MGRLCATITYVYRAQAPDTSGEEERRRQYGGQHGGAVKHLQCRSKNWRRLCAAPSLPAPYLENTWASGFAYVILARGPHQSSPIRSGQISMDDAQRKSTISALSCKPVLPIIQRWCPWWLDVMFQSTPFNGVMRTDRLTFSKLLLSCHLTPSPQRDDSTCPPQCFC